MPPTKIALLIPDPILDRCFSPADQQTLQSLGWSGTRIGPEAARPRVRELIRAARIAVTGWSSLPLDAELLEPAPDLALLCHAAGSVKAFVCPEIWARNVTVTSAAAALAVGVGEHCLGLMLSAMKNCYDLNQKMKKPTSIFQDY